MKSTDAHANPHPADTGLFPLLCAQPPLKRRAAPRAGLTRGRLNAALATLSVLGFVSALSISPALGAQARVFEGGFGCEAGVSGCTTPDPYPLGVPGGVAVDEKTGDVYVANRAVDDQQSVVVHASGGTFALVFESPVTHETKTTAPIPYEDVKGYAESKKSDEEVRAVLVNAGAGAGDVQVRGEGATEYQVTFIGALTGVDVSTMTAEGAGLTGAGASVTVSTTAAGLPGDDVQEFNEKGEFVLMFGRGVNRTKVQGVASEAEQDVCTAAEVGLGGECQGGVEGSTPGAFTWAGGVLVEQGKLLVERPAAAFLAVDQSSGDVYVADGGDGLVSKFTAAGEVVSSWGDDGPGEEPDGQLIGPRGQRSEHFGNQISGIAVDTSGNLWVDGGVQGEGADAGVDQRLFEFGAEAKLKTAWTPETGKLGQSLHPEPFGIAVDSEDDLYLPGGSGHEDVKFSSSGVLIGYLTTALPRPGVRESGAGFAVDSGGVFYRVLTDREVTEGAGTRREVGVQAFAGCHPHELFAGLCVQTGLFAGNQPPGEQAQLAVDSASAGDTLFASSQLDRRVLAFSQVTVPAVATGKPSAVSTSSATLTGTVDASGVALAHCFFEYGESESYGHVVPCVGEVPADFAEHAVHAVIAVQPGVSYHYRLVADNANDLQEPVAGGDVVFGPPLLAGESSVQVSSSAARLQAQVDPRNVDTRVRVQYGTSRGYGRETAELDVGAGPVPQAVPVALEGLAPSTTYHYRFVVQNALGEGAEAVVGPDRVFSTQGAGAFRLPDSRSWELVSPRDRHGASIEPLASSYDAGGAIQAAADGGAVSYVTNIPLEGGVQGFPEFAQVLSSRGGAGWSSRDLSVPHSAAIETGDALVAGREYRVFSEDLTKAAVQPTGEFEPCASVLGAPQPCVSAWASEQTALVQDLGSGSFTPLVSGCPSLKAQEEGDLCPPAVAEHADVPEGTIFGQTSVLTAGACPPVIYCGPFFEDATPDLSHVVVDSPVALSDEPGATAGLYEWTAGKLTFVGAGDLGAIAEQGSTDDRHAISVDGSRVFWTAGSGGHLYMRDIASGEDLQLDVPEAQCVAKGGCGTGTVSPVFQLASSNGEKMLFTDTQELTTDSGASHTDPDLYECQIVEVAGKPSCNLTDLTPANGSEPAGVQGVLPGASEDGSYVYFIANGVLGDGAEHGATPGDCQSGEEQAPGERCNLYVFHEGTTKLVAVLSGSDNPDWGALYLQAPTARVSPDGRWLAFMSDRSLTGYDNRDAVSGEPDEEVYLYDASTERLVCASCDPTGARPHGRRYGPLHGETHGEWLENSLVGSFKVWYADSWLAANIPTWTPQSYHNAVLQSRYLSDSGRLFFNTSDGLVPKDANEQQDVYEYEPEGVGPETARCGPSAASGGEVYKPQVEFETEGQTGTEGAGCVALISSGTSAEESAFMDASETGGDVFFITSAHLVPGSVENGTSLYDAHECTAGSPCPAETETPPPCTEAEGCRAAPEPQPPIYGAPSSATFSGPGNQAPAPEPAPKPNTTKPKTAAQIRAEKLTKALRACKKDTKKHKRQTCERAARAKYTVHASKTAKRRR